MGVVLREIQGGASVEMYTYIDKYTSKLLGFKKIGKMFPYIFLTGKDSHDTSQVLVPERE